MDEKEEQAALLLPQEQTIERARQAARRTAEVLAAAAMLGGIGLVRQASVDPNAEPGRFSSGALHPYGCPCSKCAAWRKSRQRFAPKPWE